MLVAVYSPHGTYDANFLANYAYINLADPVLSFAGHRQRSGIRLRSIRDAALGKPRYAGKAGHHGPGNCQCDSERKTPSTQPEKPAASPLPKGQEFTYSVLRARAARIAGRVRQIVVRETPDGGMVRVRDVARIELGSQDYSIAGRFNGKPSAIIAAYQLPGSNAVDAAAGVKKLMAQMKQRFPEDLDYVLRWTRRARSRKA